jgi:general secretion pathway protein B
MSYILDALRKADAQRERDPARGIHAQPLTLSVPAENSPSTSRLWLVGIALVVGAALLAAAMWWLGWLARPAAPAVGVAVAPNAVTVPSVTPPSPATRVLPAAPPALPLPVAPVTAPAREAPKPAPAVTAYPPATAYPPPPAASDASRLLALAELPADVQRDLPKLAISGGVYSPTPAQRLLVVNGLVLTEGAEAAPGVLLEQIRPKTAVFNFRGYRYGVPY